MDFANRVGPRVVAAGNLAAHSVAYNLVAENPEAVDLVVIAAESQGLAAARSPAGLELAARQGPSIACHNTDNRRLALGELHRR